MHRKMPALQKEMQASSTSNFRYFTCLLDKGHINLDAGGFYILEHLKRKTGIPFQMFQMDIETLKKYEDYAKPLTENDKKRLMQLEKMELPDEERKLITYMLQKGIKLEQECISESQ